MTPKALGLTPAEMRAASPFVRDLLVALSKMRDAWVDVPTDGALMFRAQLTMALKTVLAIAPMQHNRDLALKVLKHNLDVELQNQLLNALYPLPWKKTAGP